MSKFFDRTALTEHLCKTQHEAYELAAIEHGWATNPKSRVDWDDVPTENQRTMRQSMVAVLDELERLGLI